MELDIATIFQLIGSYGFPMVMCFYLVSRLEKIITENTKAIQELKELILVKKEGGSIE